MLPTVRGHRRVYGNPTLQTLVRSDLSQGDFPMYVVYVLSKDSKPLMPTKRFGHVRRMLKSGQVKAVSTKPFVIQLLYESTEYTQPLYGGTDPGRENIGEAVVNQQGEVVYEAHVTTRNKNITKLMAKRKIHRQASRRGERLRRKRRAKKNGTTTTFPEGRVLPQYKNGVLPLKDIINTEAKFANRKRSVNWITPTANQCVQTHINVIKKILKILPVTDWTLEYNKFAFMKMDDGSVRGMDFQNGRLKGFPSVNAYVDFLQKGCCILCGHENIAHHHHLVPRHEGGSDTPENIVGLCENCHSNLHKRKVKLKQIGKKKKYAGTSIVNISIPFIYDKLMEIFGKNHTHICQGWETANFREENGISKSHHSDAVCIASIGANIEYLKNDDGQPFEIWQYRNHNRARICCQHERTYKEQKIIKDPKNPAKEKIKWITIAKNRKPRFEQDENCPALSVWYENQCKLFGEKVAKIALSKLRVIKSTRNYNNMGRVLPGAKFIFKGKKYILRAQQKNGMLYLAVGYGNKTFSAKKVRVVSRSSLVYI